MYKRKKCILSLKERLTSKSKGFIPILLGIDIFFDSPIIKESISDYDGIEKTERI